MELSPERIYSFYDLTKSDVYFPPSIGKYRFKIYLNGRELVYTPLSEEEMEMLTTIEPISKVVMEVVLKTYKVMNAMSCSYLILNLIGFWNLALMYNFLQIRTQPSFSYNTLEGAAVILYERNTLVSWGSHLSGK